MPDLPDFVAEMTEEISLSNQNPFIFSNQDAKTRFFIPSSSAAYTIPEVIILSPPNSPPTLYLPNQTSSGKQVSPDSPFTCHASYNDPAVELSTTASVQSLADNIFEDQRKLQTTESSQLC